MSKSYHSTYKDLKGKTKKELEEMANDPDSILNKFAEKSKTKKEVKKQRKTNKEKKKTGYNNV